LVRGTSGTSVTIGKGRQLLLSRTNGLEQRYRVERGELLTQSLLGSFVDAVGGEQPLTWSERPMVAFMPQRPVALFARQLESRLEKVDVKPAALIKTLERAGRSKPVQSSVPGQTSYHCAVLLLNPGLIVLEVGARARPFDAVAAAIAVPTKNSKKSRVLGSTAIVFSACLKMCDSSSRFLPADSVAGRWWN